MFVSAEEGATVELTTMTERLIDGEKGANIVVDENDGEARKA